MQEIDHATRHKIRLCVYCRIFVLLAFASRKEPHYDSENYELDVEEVLIDGDWTSVTFVRCFMDLDDEVSSRRTIKFEANALIMP